MILFKSGNYINQGTYKSFQPSFINKEWKIEDMELLNLLSIADRQIGRLDMYSEYIPNIDMFISMHVIKEAIQSSKIEGTKTNVEEALLQKNDVALEKRDDWEEVQNYISALHTAVEDLSELPLSSRLIKKTHKELLKGVRGEHKLPGEFRTSQNWIGGSTLNDAYFVPPVYTSINNYMGDLEKFIHNELLNVPDLLKIAIIHYQFETIHPFLDGNGRIGRLLIILYLVEKTILKRPILYMSDYFERNRMLYYDNLTIVREKNNINQWLKFFLTGIIETAKNSIDTFDKILKLQKDLETKIQSVSGLAKNGLILLNHLFKHPLVDAQKIRTLTNISFPSIYKLLDKLESIGILKEITGAKRSKQYQFQEYIDLFK